MSENTTTVRGTEFKGCYCGCGLAVSPKATYRPGHDAAHASAEAKRVVEENPENVEAAITDPEMYDLPTTALTEKAMRIAAKRVAKANAPKRERKPRAPKSTSPDEVTGKGEIKIGRWTYPVRMLGAGKVERNEKRDGSGSWLPVSGNAAQNIDWA